MPKRKKTGTASYVPLLDIPIQILDKYFHYYAEVTRTKINEDMTNLTEPIDSKYELAE